jgi:hypothetical protein
VTSGAHWCRAIAVAALLTSCTTHGLIRTIDVAPDQAAQLTVIRSYAFVGSARTTAISVDHEDVFGIRAGEHATLKVPAGDRLIGADCTAAGTPKHLRLKLAPGEHRYVHVRPALTCPPIEVPEATAVKLIAETEPLVLKP